MNVPKAIETLEQHQKGTDVLYLPSLPVAEKLGIEALRYFEAERQRRGATKTMWLPGETKE